MTETEVRLPSHWAPLIINGDETGLSEEEMQEIEETLRSLDLWAGRCFDVSNQTDFEMAPTYAPWLLSGPYSTFTFF